MENTVTTFTTPSRKGLIFGAVLVALYGMRQELALQARHFGYELSSDYAEYARLEAFVAELKANGVAKTHDVRILDLMAHTQQTLRISHDEWEACCPIQAHPRPGDIDGWPWKGMRKT